MPAEQNSFRATCGSFAAIYVSFMEKRAKLAAAMFAYTRKARSAQIRSVLLTVVLLQLLLCANDIERNPGPGPDQEKETVLQGLFKQQEVKFHTLFSQQLEMRFQSMTNELFAKMDSVFSAIQSQVQTIQTKTASLERNYYDMQQETRTTNSAVRNLEEKLVNITTELEEKVDKLEGFSRRDNLKFFNIPQSADEDYEACAMKVVHVLRDSVPSKQWCRDDIVRAHRLGSNNNGSKPQPMIARFVRWSDKMDILTKGREGLKKKGVTVAGDLTTKQQNTIQEHRNRGLRAYYKGNRLVVAGPLQHRPLNRGSFADAARRGLTQGRDSPRASRHTTHQQGQPATSDTLRNSRSREEYDVHPQYAEDNNNRWRGGGSHSRQSDCRESLDNHHYSTGAWWDYNYNDNRHDRDWDWEMYDRRPYRDWQDYDRRSSAFPTQDWRSGRADGPNSTNLTPVTAHGDGNNLPAVDKESTVCLSLNPLNTEGGSQADASQTTTERDGVMQAVNDDVTPAGESELEINPAGDQTAVADTLTAHQDAMATRDSQQQDTVTADSDAEFDDAEEPAEDAEPEAGGGATQLGNAPVTAAAPTARDVEPSVTEAPVSKQPISEPSTQDPGVTDLETLSKQQSGEEAHVETGLCGVQTKGGGPAKRLRSNSVVKDREKRQLTLTKTMTKTQNKQDTPKTTKGTTNNPQTGQSAE